jgi:hypothetical protein
MIVSGISLMANSSSLALSRLPVTLRFRNLLSFDLNVFDMSALLILFVLFLDHILSVASSLLISPVRHDGEKRNLDFNMYEFTCV